MRKLIRMCYEVYEIKGCYRIIIDHGVKNKNLKSGAECLDEIADYIVNNGVDVIFFSHIISPRLKDLTQMLSKVPKIMSSEHFLGCFSQKQKF